MSPIGRQALALLALLVIGICSAQTEQVIAADGPTVPSDGDSIQVLLFKPGVQYAYPRWSRDGKQILFESNETGKWQLCLINADGTGLKQITRDSFNNSFPDWSPDNSRIAFVSDRGGDDDIYVMNLDGTGLLDVSNNRARDIHPYWAPDGKSLLFNSLRDDPVNFEVYQVNADGTKLHRLTRTPDTETCARFSPDGSAIVLLRAWQSRNDEVFLMSPDGSKQTNLTNSPAAEGWPVWYPDGRKILYASNPTGGFCLYSMNADGSHVAQISHVHAPWYDARASISPDGKRIAFNRQLDQSIALVTMALPAAAME